MAKKSIPFDLGNYIKNPDGSYSKINRVESPYIKQQRAINEGLIVKEKVNNFCTEEIKQQIDSTTHLSIHSSPLAVFTIDPIGKPRMTQRDKWLSPPRKPVANYIKFKNEINYQANKIGFKLPESSFHVIFYVPMPHSWSDKKKKQMSNTPHQQKPDLDNMIKAVKDSLCESDAEIWDYRITKYWGYFGKIIIYSC